MRTFFIVLGAGSVVYGAYLLHKKHERALGRMTGGCGGQQLAAGTVTGPTIVSDQGPVDNQLSMVAHYDSGKNVFPPMTYIGLPVPDMAMDNCSVYQPIKF